MPSLIPSWAPNVHPLVVHFPIVLVLAAAAVDLLAAFLRRPGGFGAAAVAGYVLGAMAAVVAYVTGSAGAVTVLIPGMAHGLVADHRRWAFVTTWYLVALVAARLLAETIGILRARPYRAIFVALGLAGAVLVHQTAERGGRLVYEQGVGVIRTTGDR